MVKVGRKRYAMSGVGRRNVKPDIKDSMFEKAVKENTDEDHMVFLAWLRNSHQEGGTETGGSLDQNDVNDNDDDPQYLIFLENTKQKGTSYVTKLEESGVPLDLHYEKEGSSSDERNDAYRRKVKKIRKGDKVEENNLNNSDKELRTLRIGSEEKFVDEDYEIALQCMQSEGYVLKAVFPNNQYVDYDCDDSGDDEVFEISYATFSNGGSFDAHVKHSQFKQKIISILKRPYDQAEYEKLLQDVSVRKPVEKNLELRSGTVKRAPSDRIGKSYLDHFEDFNKKLEELSPDKDKMLNILRGFFFWLQNIAQVGGFKPWNDTTCLAVMPGSR